MTFNQINRNAGDVNNAGPFRKPNSWEFELPPECVERDFTGASHGALLAFIEEQDAVALKRAVVEQITAHGVTHNQRALLQRACESIV